MLLLAVFALIASAVTAYAIGATVVARRDSFLRSKRGILLLVVLGLSFLFLPPQLPALGGLTSLAGAAGSMLPDLSWPSAIGEGAYIVVWLLSSIAALLVGMRIWKAGTPDWREGGKAFDASAGSRVAGLLPLADTLPAALEVLANAKLRERDVSGVSSDIRTAGRRLANALPPSDGALYQMVAAKVPGPSAAQITGLLLEGAGRRAER